MKYIYIKKTIYFNNSIDKTSCETIYLCKKIALKTVCVNMKIKIIVEIKT